MNSNRGDVLCGGTLFFVVNAKKGVPLGNVPYMGSDFLTFKGNESNIYD